MKNRDLFVLFRRALFAAILVGTPFFAGAQSLPLREVTLFTSGVAEFVHRGDVGPDGTVTLPVPAEEMADVLRSLTVLDAGGNRVAGITFPAGETLATALGRFQIDLNGVNGLAGLFQEARGAEVRLVTERSGTVTGQIVGAERAGAGTGGDDGGGTVLIATGGSTPEGAIPGSGRILSLSISRITGASFTDPEVQREFEAALALLGGAGGPQTPRNLTIAMEAAESGTVTVRYLREMPLWRTSYRGVFRDGDLLVQGWAHVDNVTSLDWEGVRLSIVSARPVTYHVDYYTPQYV